MSVTRKLQDAGCGGCGWIAASSVLRARPHAGERAVRAHLAMSSLGLLPCAFVPAAGSMLLVTERFDHEDLVMVDPQKGRPLLGRALALRSTE